MNPVKYFSLSGRGVGWSGYARLWRGPDHLLLVEANGFTENYKRFFFADIQALAVRRTAAGRIWNGIWSGLFMIFALIALQFTNPNAIETEAVVLWTIAGIFLSSLAINFAFGPTCVCHVRTAVQTEKLSAVTRLRTAEKILAQIRPLLAAAQGSLTPEETAARLAVLAGPSFLPPFVDNPYAPPVIY